MARGERIRVRGRTLCTVMLALLALTSLLLLLVVGGGMVGVVTSSDASISLRLPRKMHPSLKRINEDGAAKTQVWSETISWSPRASMIHNFLTHEECDHLIRIAMPLMRKSTVVDSKTGMSKDSRVRTSSGMFLSRGQDQVVSEIEDKIAKLTFIPKEHGEGIQVLHYEEGQKYEPHHDFFYDTFNTKNGGQRVATVLMYLTDVEEGGETVFPKSALNATSLPYYDKLSQCARKGISVIPKRGDALLFWSMSPNSEVDYSSLHGGCPVIKGDKWSATKWLRIKPYQIDRFL